MNWRTQTMRDRCYSFYWKARSRITPGLEHSQAIYERVLENTLRTRAAWLDVGCGHSVLPYWRAADERELVGSVRQVVGVDCDHASLVQHHTIRRRVRADIEILPFGDASFDIVTANMVLEHVATPERLLAEIFRVLRPGGIFLGHTPNITGYITVLTRLIPEAIKPSLIKLLQGRAAADVFPTHYRINSEAAFERLGQKTAFSRVTVRYVASDAQFIMIPPLVVLELLGIRQLMTDHFQRFRPYLIVTMEK